MEFEETHLTPLCVIFLFCNEGFGIPMCKFVPGRNGEWLGKVLYTVGIIIRDGRVVAQFFDLLLSQEGREAIGQEGQRSVGKQVVGLFLGDSFPMSQVYWSLAFFFFFFLKIKFMEVTLVNKII